MLKFEELDAFRRLLEADQALSATIELTTGIPGEVDVVAKSGCTAYEELRHIYTVTFNVDYWGKVTINVHIQWQPLRALIRKLTGGVKLQNALHWDSFNVSCVHLRLEHPEQPGVVYSCILEHSDLRSLWVQMGHSVGSYPNSKNIAAEDIWTQLVGEGVLEL